MITAAEFLKWCNVFKIQTGGGGGGSVVSVGTGTGLTGGTITTSGTISFAAIAAMSFWANATGGSAVPTVVPFASAPWLLLAGGTMAGNINMGFNSITNVPNPGAANDVCNKSYADSIAAGFTPVGAVYCASTANLTGYTYDNGTAGVGASLTAPSPGVFSSDGVSPPVGQFFLYKDDTDGSGAYNGIYQITTSTGGSPALLTRATYYDQSSEIVIGNLVSVTFGNTLKGSSWTQNNTVVTVGTDPIAFSIFFNPAMYLQAINNLSDLNDIPTAVANLSLTIGVNTQAFSAALTSIAGLTTAANNLIYTTASNTYATLAPANSSVLVSGVAGAFSWTTALPSGLTATNMTLTTPAIGTPSSGVLTNCTGLPIAGLTGLGTGVATALAANVTGSGGIVLATSPILVTPAIGTPSSGVLTNCTGLPIAGLTGLGTGVATALALAVTGSGSIVLATSPTLVTPVLGTPASGNLANCTGFPASGITGLATGIATWLGAPSSANLFAAQTDKTGTGLLVFNTSPTFVTPVLGTPSSGNLSNCTALPLGSITGLGTGVATALALAVTGSGSIVLATSPTLVTPALGTPSSGVLTNCTGFPAASLAGLGTGVATALALAVTGSGSIVLATSPTLVTPALGTPSSGVLTNCTGLPLGSITGLGTGIATALALAANGSGAVVLTTSPALVTPALGTPSSGNLINCTGYPFTAVTGTLEPQGRLTLTTNVPVTNTDVTAATTIYYTPYVGNLISLFDGVSAWNVLAPAQISIAVPAGANTAYDVFCYNNAGTATLELTAWTNVTTRATALVYQNGILVKSGATTRRYLGSFCTIASGQTEDSYANRYLWNYYNRRARPMQAIDTTNSWTYSTATYREARAQTTNQLNFFVGVSEDPVTATVNHLADTNTGGATPASGIGLDSTTVSSAIIHIGTTLSDTTPKTYMSSYSDFVAVGQHFLAWLERGHGSNTQTWYGDNGGVQNQTGIFGTIWG